ncbi:type II secretion system protein [Leifsonia shinshuensis]|uniref:PulJ/GspJ family protein n=1 Tax=Leifsonia shinshuensis TaxID=150026 RepID=UPI0028566D5B|nr:type II secretion system protein [Leifsonia shinshuensis]MDR6971507.1 prepilin-type N-terminal cleavage/methylation domain-containing protein [Leifsonia shinshuensis]
MITRRHPKADDGFTIAEMLVAMAILGLLLAMVAGFFSLTTKAFTQNQQIGGNAKSASNVMNEISRILRAATENPVSGQALNDPAFVSATPESVTVYAYVNLASSLEQPVKVQFSLDAKRNVVETKYAAYSISPGYWGFQTSPSSVRTLGGTVVTQTGSNPSLFTYLGVDGTAIAIPAGGYTTNNLRSIAAVRVTLTVSGTAAGNSSNVTLQNTVGLPNLPLARTL